MSKQKNPSEIHEEFVVTISEIDEYLQHKKHILSIQLHSTRKKDLIDILIGWFENDYHETLKLAKGHDVKHCSECGKPYVFEHLYCPKQPELRGHEKS